MQFTMHPIGIIHSPFREKKITPIQSSRSSETGRIEIFTEYLEGLQDIDDITYIILLYIFHRSSGYDLSVKPFLDDEKRGLFATRYPKRPNPIGISIVKLVDRQENILIVEGIDVLDQTPLLDIKPFIPEFDNRTGGSTGWYAKRAFK